MIESIKNKFILALTSYLMVLLAFIQFLNVYQIEKQFQAMISIFLFSLSALIFNNKVLRFCSYILSLLLSLYLFYPFSKNFLNGWLNELYIQIVTSVQSGYYSEKAAVFILFLLIIILLELIINYKLLWLPRAILIIYLLTLAIYNSNNFFIPIIIIISIGIFQNMYLNFKQKHIKTRWLSCLSIICILSVISLVSVYFPRNSLENFLLEKTTSVRNFMNEKGIYSFIQQSNARTTSRTGFSENDERLGGPILDDNQIVFEAIQSTAHYWRVESKAVYTGLGWQDNVSDKDSISLNSSNELTRASTDYNGELADSESISLSILNESSYVPVPYGNFQVAIQDGAAGFEVNNISERIDFLNYTDEVSLELNWENFAYTTDDLANVQVTIPPGFVDYLQLPDSFPVRIRALTSEIVQGQTSLIGQVTAIENYLKNSDTFRYSKIDAVLPDIDEDYVEQFLFDTRVGYCDNFSTAMTVMLRSIGVPARWVKGFSTGEAVGSEQSGTRFAIRNNDAHSWTEVYFEGFGWLPFEPTPSFSQPMEEAITSETEDNLSATVEVSSTSESESVASSESTTESDVSNSEEVASTEKVNDHHFWDSSFRKLIVTVIIIIVIIFIIFILYKWFIYLFVLLMIYFSKQPIRLVYPYLLKKSNILIKRSPTQSLLNHASAIEENYSILGGAFIQLTEIYESYLYSDNYIQNLKQIELMKSVAKMFSSIRFERRFKKGKKAKH